MNSIEAIKHLTEQYSHYDWFDHVDLDSRQRYVVYVKFMNEETIAVSQQNLDGVPVLTAWATSKPSYVKAKYNTVKTLSELRPYTPPAPDAPPVVELDEDALDDLVFELDRLERLCGSKSLQDIFYEIHDGRNAVSNVSDKFPYVRSCMNKLYDTFGFDVIYEELDG